MHESDLTDLELFLVSEAKAWMGFAPDTEAEFCEDGSVWVGLTCILGKGSIVYRMTEVECV